MLRKALILADGPSAIDRRLPPLYREFAADDAKLIIPPHPGKLAKVFLFLPTAARRSAAPDKTLKIFTAGEGGAQHCPCDYLTLDVAGIWNWFEDQLKP